MGKPTDPTLKFRAITFNPQPAKRENDLDLIGYFHKEPFEVDGILYNRSDSSYFTAQCMISIRFDQTADLDEVSQADYGWDSQYKWENFIGPLLRYY